MQSLVKLALEPECDAVFEPNSFGFRPGRSVHDAAVAVKHGLGAEGTGGPDRRARCPRILDADIQSFFRQNYPTPIPSRVPALSRADPGWLQTGVLTGG